MRSADVTFDTGIMRRYDREGPRYTSYPIMCQGFVDAAAIEGKHGIEFDCHFENELVQIQDLRADGLVDLTDGRIALTAVGRLLMRNVAMTFDAYLGADVRPPMSRVI